jgi:alkyldihydroxyacetonephosphate synthase
MRRWNGWGDTQTTYPLPAEAHVYLNGSLGEGRPFPDAAYETVLSAVPSSRLQPHPLLSTDGVPRLLHARGQSLPDWVALRSGRIGVFPDGVALPRSEPDVRDLLEFAAREDAQVIPFGGGTSVVGHVNPTGGPRPVLSVDLSLMNRMLDLDEVSRLATFEAGASGPQVEAQLAERGFTLGHFPQSFEYSTLGGWVATRSTGQQSLRYGRIEDLFAGGHLETPVGPLDLPPLPASAAGPDLRQIVLGSEGRLGIVTRVVVRVRPRPRSERFAAVFYRSWEDGMLAVRQAVQDDLPVSMLRLCDAVETEMTMELAGRPRMVKWARRGLGALGYGSGRCLLIFAVTDDRLSAFALGGLPAGRSIGEMWRRSRFRSAYLRNTLWEAGFAIDAIETAVPWAQVVACAEAMLAGLRTALERRDERVLAFAHLSHVYRDGASIYVTFLFRRTADPDEMIERWRRLKSSGLQALLAHGGTVSHQHGVGVDHAPYLAREKGAVGLSALAAACRAFDPDGRMNPGKLLA